MELCHLVRFATLSFPPLLCVLLRSQGHAAGPSAVRLFMEAEEFGSLVRYPDDRPELKRWYAREVSCRAYGAPGKEYLAAVHDTANTLDRTINKKLEKPLKPGKYRVFVRVAGNVYQDADNILRISIGDSAVDFRWRRRRRPPWLPGLTVQLTRPAVKVSMTAVQFGGVGLRILYECEARSIWVDSIYITSDMDEKNPPTWALEQSLRLNLPITSQVLSPGYKLALPRIEQYRTPEIKRDVVAKMIPPRSFDGRKNVWPNGSFELGMNDGWAATNLPYRYAYVFSERDHDLTTAAHGRYSLRIPAGANPFSRIYQVEKPGKMTLSAYLRGAGAGKVTLSLLSIGGRSGRDRGKPLISIATEVTGKWQRFSASGEVPTGPVCLQVRNTTKVWLYGVQLEAGELTEFAPRAELEGALATDKLGNILYANGKDTLLAWFHNSSKRVLQASIRYRIVHVWEREIAAGKTLPVRVRPGASVARAFTIPQNTGGSSAPSFA